MSRPSLFSGICEKCLLIISLLLVMLLYVLVYSNAGRNVTVVILLQDIFSLVLHGQTCISVPVRGISISDNNCLHCKISSWPLY